MSEPGEKDRKRFVVDTNVFVAAIKPFAKLNRERAPEETGSFSLLLALINDGRFELFASVWLLDEYKRLGEELNSSTSDLVLGQLTAKMHEITSLEEEAIARCKPHLPKAEAADVLHAATALQAGAVLISNDKDFDRIRGSGVIEVWSISEAIKRLSIEPDGKRR